MQDPTSPRQTPQVVQRAKRLKLLREMTGLSRDKFQHRHGISRGTIQNWETARFGGLTVKGANAIIQAVSIDGLQVDINWLMHGIGHPPSTSQKATSADLEANDIDNMHAVQALIHFRSLYDDVMDTIVTDQAAFPWIQAGDLIAGIRAHPSDYPKHLHQFCIVHTAEKGLLVRRLGQTQHQIFFLATAELMESHEPVIYGPTIISLAPISWIWRSDSKPFTPSINQLTNTY